MKTFHANQIPDIKMFEVKKRVNPCLAAQVNEPFSVGAKNGVMQGKAGDYLLSNENGLSVVKEADFDLLYEGVDVYIIDTDTFRDNVDPKDLVDDLKAIGIRAEAAKIVKKPKKVVAKKSSKEIYQKVVKKVAPKKTVKKKKATFKKKN